MNKSNLITFGVMIKNRELPARGPEYKKNAIRFVPFSLHLTLSVFWTQLISCRLVTIHTLLLVSSLSFVLLPPFIH